jgi:predicted ATP-grasp superfamily ATP-dependent carboligase
LSTGLIREGDIMLRSLVMDLADVPGVEVVTARDRRLSDPDLPARVHWIDPARDAWSEWRELIAQCDAAWPIAPETDCTLARWSELIRSSGCALIGSGRAALRITMSKRQTAAHLAALGIPVVPTSSLVSALESAPPASRTGWVVKPDDGAGSEETWLMPTIAELRRWTATRPDRDRFIVQPYVHGISASLSLICCRGRATLLACNLQDVRLENGRFRYHGGVVGGFEGRRARYEPLADRIAAAVPELWGYVGVDLVDGAAGPMVLEINARLTTSYVGLRHVLGINTAALVLGLLAERAPPSPTPRPWREHVIAIDTHAA